MDVAAVAVLIEEVVAVVVVAMLRFGKRPIIDTVLPVGGGRNGSSRCGIGRGQRWL